MGVCYSGDRTINSVETAKLVLEDGRLEQYSSPVRVSRVLESNPKCFVCNADDMDFDDYVYAMNGDEELQMGKLYFLLPLSWLNSPLKAPEIASSAVKASLALQSIHSTRGADGLFWCGKRRKTGVIVWEDDSSILAVTGRGGGGRLVVRRREGGGGGGGEQRRKLSTTTKLNVILEEEEEVNG